MGSSKGKALAMIGIAAALMESIDQVVYDQTPRPRMDTSKPATLTTKEWKRRKRRLEITKHSRRQNRN